MLSARNIHKKYGSVEVLKGVDIDVRQGEIVSIVGPSGSGKSTLLHILGTLDLADAGFVEIDGVRIESRHDREENAASWWKRVRGKGKLSADQLSDFRNRKIGFVFQFHHLLPEFTALENVCIAGWIQSNKKDVKERAIQLLTILGLEQRLHNKPSQLSGGEQQRVAVARALINRPSIVFADEPTGNLDTVNARELHQLFFDLRKEFNQTFLIVTHNEELAKISDRMLTMKDGKMEQ